MKYRRSIRIYHSAAGPTHVEIDDCRHDPTRFRSYYHASAASLKRLETIVKAHIHNGEGSDLLLAPEFVMICAYGV